MKFSLLILNIDQLYFNEGTPTLFIIAFSDGIIRGIIKLYYGTCSSV